MPLRYRRETTAGWADAGTRVLGWVKAMVCDDEDSAVSLSANLCGHAACGGEETVILFMRRGERDHCVQDRQIGRGGHADGRRGGPEADPLAHRVICVR